jgi:alpha-maltose-1-phosphate synthase
MRFDVIDSYDDMKNSSEANVTVAPPASHVEVRGRRTVVANPGAIAEMAPLAAGVARAGNLRKLVLPVSDQLPIAARMHRLAPSFLRSRIGNELKRRGVPPEVNGRAQHVATGPEVAFVLSQRLRLPTAIQTRLVQWRNEAFDRKLSQLVEAQDATVVVTSGAALETLKRAKSLGVATFLEYPIAHHAFSEEFLAEEARLQPEYARTLQFHKFSDERRARLEAEIDLADFVLVLSSFQASTFVRSGVPAEKLVVVPLGVDSSLFAPLPRVRGERFRILFVGQVGQRKGISYLFEAARMVSASIPLEIILVGNVVGTSKPWSRLPFVRHVPHVPRSELPRLYAAADVFVLPSLIEGFGLTALEAMASNLPVIVSTHTFGSDVVEDGSDGYVVSVRNTDGLAERLALLGQSVELRESMGRAARRKAEAFSWTHYGDSVAAELKARGAAP